MAEDAQTQKIKADRFPCPSCGADLVYDPQENSLKCPYCGQRVDIAATTAQVVERDYEEYLRPKADQLSTIASDAIEVKCNGCGATVTFTPPEVAGECAFCGNKIVAQPKAADPMVAPEGVLPFVITDSQARDAIRKWIASLWFAPNALKKLASHESVSGVYLPFWTYDTDTSSQYEGQRGEHYYVTETYTERDANGNAVTRTRQVQRTNWYHASGRVSRFFDDVLVPASRSIARPRLASLEPWDLGSIKPYEPAYLSGYKAQRYEIEMNEGFEEAKELMARVIEQDVRQDIGGDEQRIEQVTTSYSSITFKHLLLPVYIGAYRFNQKVYQVMINARTGEVQGDRPYSVWKITFLILFILLVIALFVYFGKES